MEEKIRLAVFGQKRLSREGGIEIVVKELCTRMAQNGCDITCYNRAGHHVSGCKHYIKLPFGSNLGCLWHCPCYNYSAGFDQFRIRSTGSI